jgi:GT2 family glycosyltransferase
MEAKMKATFVLVNYFGEEALKDFVENQLRKQQGVELDVIIVDNGHRNPQTLHEMKGVQLLEVNQNLGYLGALNHAVKSVSVTDSDFIVLSNFDLRFGSEHDLETLFTFGHQHKMQVFGPQIINLPSEAAANPMYRHRPEKAFYRRLLFVTSFYPFYWMYQMLYKLKKATQRTTPSVMEPVYAIHGSMMVFDKTFVSKGNFEHPAFLYGEEILIAEQCHAANWKIGYDAQTRLYHQEHSTTGSIKNRRHMRYLHESLKAIYRKYYS